MLRSPLPPARSPLDPSAADAARFQAARPRVYAAACRVLGDPCEADDVVQETWIRWQTTDRSQVRDAPAFLTTVSRRLALNVAQSARARHETAMPAWLPEPVDGAADPAAAPERDEAVARALLALSERLTPPERAAYLLREAFDYPYRRISEVLALSEANARQLVVRARRHVASAGGLRQVPATEQRRLVSAFTAAAEGGDLAELERTLTFPSPTNEVCHV